MLKRVIGRALRASAASAVGFLVNKWTNDPVYGTVLAPVLMTLGKLIRERYPKLAAYVPF